MKSSYKLCLFLGLFSSNCPKLEYPQAKQIECIDDYFGTKISDPYRWMENLEDPDLATWISNQNKLAEEFITKKDLHKEIKDRVTEIINYPKCSAPKMRGDFVYFWKNDGLQEQAIFYRHKKDYPSEIEVVIDPNKFSKDGTVALKNTELSKSAKYAAYSISKNGTDFEEIFVMDLATKEVLKDHVEWVKFSGISWNGDEGFYYCRYDQPENKDFDQKTLKNKKAFYHKVGTDQKDDILIFEDKENPSASFGVGVTFDNRLLILSQHKGASGGNSLHVKDLLKENSQFEAVVPAIVEGEDYSVFGSIGSKLFIQTNKDAPKEKVVTFDLETKKWTTIIEENKDSVLNSTSLVQDKLLVTYLHNVHSQLKVFSLDGKEENIVELPSIGIAGGFGGRPCDKEVYFSFESPSYPPTIFKYELQTKKVSVYKKSEIKISTDQFKTEQVLYTSFDGTQVPMFITYKKDIKLDGTAPALLTAYGSHGHISYPLFSPSRLVFLERGCIHITANIRGGGEFGKDWHYAAKCLKKNISTLDFIAAADALVEKGYTSQNKLCITGGSSGGRLVAEAINLRPDLCKVCIPCVGTMDMLRFHKFTIGYMWKSEYGDPEKEDECKQLLTTSPLHNIKENGNYPATLVIATDHDDRVFPAHSYKYTATLQEKNTDNKNPLLIKIKTKQGHGTSQLSQAIEHTTDLITFWLSNIN